MLAASLCVYAVMCSEAVLASADGGAWLLTGGIALPLVAALLILAPSGAA